MDLLVSGGKMEQRGAKAKLNSDVSIRLVLGSGDPPHEMGLLHVVDCTRLLQPI